MLEFQRLDFYIVLVLGVRRRMLPRFTLRPRNVIIVLPIT